LGDAQWHEKSSGALGAVLHVRNSVFVIVLKEHLRVARPTVGIISRSSPTNT
jgi:hypothetical protein